MKIAESLSPHFEPRAAGKKIWCLILHCTEKNSVREWIDEALAIGVSSHYVVDTDGAVTRIVPEDKRAWHAGESYWAGEVDINSCSVGIEVQNPGGVPYPATQIDAVVELCRDIVARHNILPQHVLAHSDVAPGRKADPGELFPWRELATRGLGLWPQVETADRTGGGQDLGKLLVDYGYNPAVDIKTLAADFHRHFRPGVVQADIDSVYIAKSLLRLKK